MSGGAGRRRALPALLFASFFLLLSLPSCGRRDLLLPIASSRGFGYADGYGRVAISPRYQWADGFSEGRARVVVDGRTGFIDSSGGYAIEPRFDWAGRFSEGLAVVEVEGRYGYADREGRLAIAPRFDLADAFCGGLAVVVTEGRYGYIDASGGYAIAPRFDWAGRFSEGLALTLEGSAYGYVDHSGELAITLPPPAGLPQPAGEGEAGGRNLPDIEQWQSLLSYRAFSQGLALMEEGGRYGYVDASGRTAIAPSFESARAFSEGRAAVRTGREWGFIDPSGRTVIEPGPEEVGPFSEGLAPYRKRGVWGYMDASGGVAISPRYDGALGFSSGLAPVEVGGAWGYVDRRGGYVWKPSGPDTELDVTRPSRVPLALVDLALALCLAALALGAANCLRALRMLRRGEGGRAVDDFLERYHSSKGMRRIRKGPFVLDEHLEKLLANNRALLLAGLVFLLAAWLPNLLFVAFAGRGILNYYVFHKNAFPGDDLLYNVLGTATLLAFLAFCLAQRALLNGLLAYLKGAGPERGAGEAGSG